jgi:CRISPR/Cas system type I-B associated protein Csh2 (Cas7 group RAMP superfamily)
MSEKQETIWREGDRIRRTNGAGYGDLVSDLEIRRHIRDHAEDDDPTFVAFAEAVLAIRAFERLTRADEGIE